MLMFRFVTERCIYNQGEVRMILSDNVNVLLTNDPVHPLFGVLEEGGHDHSEKD